MKEILNEIVGKYAPGGIRYEDLSKWAVGEAVIKGSVNLWGTLEFLNGITNQKKKEMVAIAFDNMAHDLFTENERVVKIANRYNFNCAPDDNDSEHNFSFETIIFPIIRRIIAGVIGGKEGVSNFNYDKFLDYLEDLSFLAINYDGYYKECDIEAEFCEIISDLIIERFKNEK